MKKIAIIAASALVVMSQSALATQARINALGGVNAIILEDDANIDLFPQEIENYSMLTIGNLQAADTANQSSYAAIIGDSGKKWGIYGGKTEDETGVYAGAHHNRELLSLYHSVNANAAYKVGVTMSSYDSDPFNGNKVYNMGVDFTYGMKSGNTESAIVASYDKDPYGLEGCRAADAGTGVATFPVNGCGNISATAYRSYHDLTVGYRTRSPMSVAMFSHLYWDATLTRVTANYNTSTATTDDVQFSGTQIAANAWLFNKKTFHQKDSFYYSVGFGFLNQSATQDIEQGNSDKFTNRAVMGPMFAIGLEKPIKYGALRFGINRMLTLYQTQQQKTTNNAGTTVVDTNDNRRGADGAYTVSTGWGLEYENLKLDLVLNSDFWGEGPQKLFGFSATPIAARADIVYDFK